jgi:hypothetical protein
VTISDYLMQRGKRLTYWYMASFIPMVLVLIFKPHSFPFLFGSLVVMSGSLIAMMLLSSRVPCPRCARPMGAWTTVLGQPKRNYHCPHCNVRIDTPMEFVATRGNVEAESNPNSRL